MDRDRLSIFSASVVAAMLCPAATARADDKQVCSAAYEATQSLRKDGKLQAAREQAAVCIRDACADFIRTDCAKWLGEIDAAQPTIVLDVKDAAGQETSAVKVTLDGKPWVDKLDGTAKPIDPGHHVLSFALEGSAPMDQAVEAKEGDKNRLVSVSFQTKSSSAEGGSAGDDSSASKRSVLPWVAGGVGAVGFVTFGVMGALTLGEQSTNKSHCSDVNHTCDAQGQSAASTGKTFGALATTGLIVGVVGVGTSVVLFATRGPKKTETSLALGSWLGATGGGGSLVGKW